MYTYIYIYIHIYDVYYTRRLRELCRPNMQQVPGDWKSDFAALRKAMVHDVEESSGTQVVRVCVMESDYVFIYI